MTANTISSTMKEAPGKEGEACVGVGPCVVVRPTPTV